MNISNDLLSYISSYKSAEYTGSFHRTENQKQYLAKHNENDKKKRNSCSGFTFVYQYHRKIYAQKTSLFFFLNSNLIWYIDGRFFIIVKIVTMKEKRQQFFAKTRQFPPIFSQFGDNNLKNEFSAPYWPLRTPMFVCKFAPRISQMPFKNPSSRSTFCWKYEFLRVDFFNKIFSDCVITEIIVLLSAIMTIKQMWLFGKNSSQKVIFSVGNKQIQLNKNEPTIWNIKHTAEFT